MLTLRQIEAIRAIMVTGSVDGAARLLNVSSPGISRVMKHAEASVGVKLFSRRGGRYTPTPQANAIFNQINSVYGKVEDLQFVISRIKRGANTGAICQRIAQRDGGGKAARGPEQTTSC
jgi:DNA-binding transcriptional LysR family regulator